ncbi:hypothetical protein [Haloprofundus halobius]|uniref:hypothetical protein n=1 Tax=Haloprofundus halobius TaxID=2876194 RepID=UPI001CC9255F|nr:hypothetical protein [Haloprofundus halobius]
MNERFPHLAADIGEDPARFLDRDLVERGPRKTDTTSLRLVKARIRGIDSLAVCRAWQAVERRLDRGPRDGILELLEERDAWLVENGDRDERLELGIRRDVSPEDVVSCARFLDEDGELRDRTSASSKIHEMRQSPAVATDGGDDQ